MSVSRDQRKWILETAATARRFSNDSIPRRTPLTRSKNGQNSDGGVNFQNGHSLALPEGRQGSSTLCLNSTIRNCFLWLLGVGIQLLLFLSFINLNKDQFKLDPPLDLLSWLNPVNNYLLTLPIISILLLTLLKGVTGKK